MKKVFLVFIAVGMGQMAFGNDRIVERQRTIRKDLVAVGQCFRSANSKQHAFELITCEEIQTYLVKQNFEIIAGLYERVTSEDVITNSANNYGQIGRERMQNNSLSSDLDSEIHESACKRAREGFVNQVVTAKTACGPGAAAPAQQ